MRLLIATQAVDRKDPVLGFFHRWIEEFARNCEHVIVICLRKGDFSLPDNVEVIALSKGRISRAFEVCSIAFGRRRDYDSVFVHMNPEYLVAAGWLWRLLGKKSALWYAHKSVDPKLRVAEKFASAILTASKESFRLPSTKVHILGHGIDTGFFVPDLSVPRGKTLLSVGRLSKSKRHDLVIRAAALAGRELHVVGEGEEREALERVAHECGADVQFLGGLTQEKVRDEYRQAMVFIHASETGSMDKVVLEALSTDCPVITTSNAYAGLPVVVADVMPEALAAAIAQPHEKNDWASSIHKHHSLAALIPRILQKIA